MKAPIRYGPHGKYVEVFGAPSASNQNKVYTVARTAQGQWSCSCPVWIFNSARPECKHIRHVKSFNTTGFASVDLAEYVPMPPVVEKALSRFSMLDVS